MSFSVIGEVPRYHMKVMANEAAAAGEKKRHPVIRVRYAETDQMGVAYHANYFIWFEVGRTHYCRVRGFAYADMERKGGLYLPVIEAQCRYLAPIRYDERFFVETSLAELRSRRIVFDYRLTGWDRRAVLAEGRTIHAVTGGNGRVRKIPEEYRRILRQEPQVSECAV